uniref:Uncharacterized protein n=1 Tax=Micrurus corallinus TaxID=54390 RepID=A0A2D4FR20_MICCO
MIAIGFRISVTKPQSHKIPPYLLVTTIPAVLVAMVNQISQSLREGNFLLASHDQISGETDKKLQVPDGFQASQQVNKWLLLMGEGMRDIYALRSATWGGSARVDSSDVKCDEVQ